MYVCMFAALNKKSIISVIFVMEIEKRKKCFVVGFFHSPTDKYVMLEFQV